MDYLKRKYPEHSDRLDGKTLAAESPAVSNGFYETDLDNLDTMSEIDTEATGFRRGGRLRSSLPVVRPIVNKTKERPLGLIYLRYKNETKRALMPNEVTGIDTVRALYVRAFPKQLNMRMLEQPERKIYIKDTTTDIFYELENVNDIHDRTVLKIYEPGFVEDPNLQGPSSPRSTASTPVELDYYSEPEVDHMKRDTRPNRYQAMTLPRNMQYTQEGGGVQRPPNLTSSPDKGGGRQPPPPDNFRRGAPERASATIPRPAAHNQAFQRLTPERASVSGPVNRGPNSAPPQGRRGPPPPRREGSATMPRRMPQDGSWNGGQRPQNSATMPRPKGGVTAVDDGGFSALRPAGESRGFAESARLSKSQPLTDPIKYSMQPQTSAMPEQNGRPQPRGPHPHQQTPPGRPVNQCTLPRNGAPGPRHPIPNGTGPPPQRGPGPLRRHGSHEGPLQGRPHSAPSIEGAVPPRQGVHPGAQRPYSQPATRTLGRPPSVEEDTNERIMAMEQQIANLAGMVRSVIGPRNGTPRQAPVTQRDGQRPPGDPRQPAPRRESPMVRTDSVPQQTRPAGPGPQQIRAPGPQQTRAPAPQQTRAPAPQQARPPGPQQPGRPHPHQPGGVNVQRSAMVLKHRTTDLRMQLKQLRKMHLNMVQQMNNNFRSTSHKIRVAMESAPGSDKHPIRNQRGRVHQEYIRYMQAQEKIERELRELDQNVEKLRDQTISHRGSVDTDRIDHLAQALGNSSRRIAEQKVTFPVLAEKLKAVQEGEMEIVVREENWMKHEPQRLDDYLKRSKKITSTLYTLKRMAATHNEPHATLPIVPTAATVTISNVEPPKHVERIESVPLPENMAVRPANTDTNEVPAVHHKLPRRFKSPEEQEAFERKLEEKREELKKTSHVNALATRHRRNLREMYDQENHDAMTPIITPEKAAKKEAQKETSAAQKKGPPPPPPPRRHFPVSPPPEQSEKKITWSTTETTSKKPKKNVKIKSPPPPVAAKPQPITKTTSHTVTKTTPKGVSKTTTTTTTKRSYQIEDMNQALDELESLAFKATETTDLASEDSNIIKDRA